MQNAYDWLRICRTGGELIATIDLVSDEPDLPGIVAKEESLGSPQTAFTGPCLRCSYYERLFNKNYCYFCNQVMVRENVLRSIARHSVALWCFVNYPPKRNPKTSNYEVFSHIVDNSRFICCTNRWNLKNLLQEMMMMQGPDWLGTIQIFPVFKGGDTLTMSDLLCSAIFDESALVQDQLYVKFFSSPFQFVHKREREREGKLIFEVTDFIGYLEMAEIFKRGLYLEEQDRLRQVLEVEDVTEKQFYWGRFLAQVRPEARDFLDSWKMKTWTESQISLFYELLDFVKFDPDKCISNIVQDEE
jgi:hypothetical protein